MIGLGDVVDEPAREERRQRQFREDHQLDAMRCRLAKELEHPSHDLLAAVVALHGPELRGSDGEHS